LGIEGHLVQTKTEGIMARDEKPESDAERFRAPTRTEMFIAKLIGLGIVIVLVYAFFHTTIFYFNIGLEPGVGTITEKYIETGDESNDNILEYDFEVDGKKFHGSGPCEDYTFKKLNVGDKVPIKYFKLYPDGSGSTVDFKNFHFQK